MEDRSFLVMGVALLTWGVFFFYFLRLDALTRRLENEVRAAEEARQESENRKTDNRKTPVA
jgi:hypothetical protein